MRPEPEAAGTNSHLGRGCGRSGRRLLRALGHASTDALPRVLVASCGSARPASQSASFVRRPRAPGVGSCARSVTHRRMRSLACTSPPAARHAPPPNLLRSSDGPGLRVSSPARAQSRTIQVRSFACSSPPTAHLAGHPKLHRPIGGSGLGRGIQSAILREVVTPPALVFANFLAPNMTPAYAYVAERVGTLLGRGGVLAKTADEEALGGGHGDGAFLCRPPYARLAARPDPPTRR